MNQSYHDFKLIGIVDNKRIESKNLDSYFILPKNKKTDLVLVREKMKGLKYKVVAENYVFRKIE